MEKHLYDPHQDPRFARPVIDRDEWQERHLPSGEVLPYRFLHGSFEGTDVKFSFCFPPEEKYENRFQQYLSPFPGPDEEMASFGQAPLQVPQATQRSSSRTQVLALRSTVRAPAGQLRAQSVQ